MQVWRLVLTHQRLDEEDCLQKTHADICFDRYLMKKQNEFLDDILSVGFSELSDV